ncbi:hypothetical protein FHT17_002226 [Novosphingobium sp. SG916]|nr:hypothetical protein [Novosphingobium sp. SG919]NMN87327.1 hypothetical protein [Novosphingobium sp. SG916]
MTQPAKERDRVKRIDEVKRHAASNGRPYLVAFASITNG